MNSMGSAKLDVILSKLDCLAWLGFCFVMSPVILFFGRAFLTQPVHVGAQMGWLQEEASNLVRRAGLANLHHSASALPSCVLILLGTHTVGETDVDNFPSSSTTHLLVITGI